MAVVSKSFTHQAQSAHQLRLWPKIAAATFLILTARIIIAQQAAPETPVREEVDAQGYKVQIPSEKLRKNKTDEQKIRGQARAVLNGTGTISDPATRVIFRGFYLSYLFPMMTTEEGLKTLGKERQDLLRDLQFAKSADAHREVVEFTRPAMEKIVADSAYRPAVRYNAMLILSSLNDVEPNAIGSTQSLPEPTKAALPFILQQFQKADRDEIKLAALLGLARHLEWDNYKQAPATPMPVAGRNAIVKELVALAEAKEAPEGRENSVHLWMRRRAIEALSMACLTKGDADITAVMEKLLRDETDSTSIRLAVASALGRMSLQAPAKIDPVATAKELGYLALKATDAELARAEAHRKAELEHEARLAGNYQGDVSLSGPGGPGGGRMGGPGGMDGMGGGRGPLRPTPGMGTGGEGGYGMPGGEMGGLDPSMQDPKHFEVEYVRRRLRQNLYAVQLGLLGGEDHIKSKTTKAPSKTETAPNPNADKKVGGVFVVAKTAQERDEVDKIYFLVRDVAESVESAGTTADFYQLLKDVKKPLKLLEEAIGRRVAAAGAAAGSDDAPSAAPGKARPKVPAGKGKAAPPVAKPGKAPVKAASAKPPAVFAKPR